MKGKRSAPRPQGDKPGKIGLPKVKLAEVAEAAGVSAATVSRVLNNSTVVSDALRKKVEKAAQKLGYVADGAARALASRRSRALGAVVPNLSNTIFSDMIEAFQQRLEPHGYTTLLATFDYDEAAEYRAVRTMLERGVDGIVLVGVTHGKELLTLLEKAAIPFVQTWAPARASKFPTIGYDNALAARLLVDHLVGLGHRDIGIVAGQTRHNDRVRARVAGLRAAMKRHRLALPVDRVVETEYKIAKIRDAFRGFQRKGEMPTALIANNDIVALGLLMEAQAQGIQVPKQLSITGVGDLEIVAHIKPALTTLRTPKRAFGTMAADYLLARIQGHEFVIPDELPLELVVRESTAPPRASRNKDKDE